MNFYDKENLMAVQKLVADFQEAFEQDTDLPMQYGLIREEALEVFHALHDGDRYELAKELADLAYVTYGLAQMAGINLGRVIRDVHKSNMSKLSSDGTPIFREDGKVLKSSNYVPPIPRKSWFIESDALQITDSDIIDAELV